MKRLFLLFFCTLSTTGEAQQISAPLVTLNTLGAAPSYTPVCNQAFVNTDGGLNTAGYQTQFRATFYCPQGAKSLQLVFTGFYLSGLTETALVSPIPYNLSVVTNVPAPWSSGTTYAPGQSVAYYATISAASTFADNNIYTAAATNTNSPPAPPNANWSAGAVLSPAAFATCNGGRSCTLGTTLQPNGSFTSQGLLITDPINVSVPVGGYIEVVGWTNQTGSQQLVNNNPEQFTAGQYFHQGATEADYTATNANGAIISFSSYPAVSAVLGIPVNKTANVCVLTDSRGVGVDGGGLGSESIQSGGSGYTSADEGLVLSLPDTNASSYEVGRSASVIIQRVSSGSVAAASIVDTGSYAGTNNSQSFPSGTQTMVGGHGTGFAIAPTFNSSGLDFGDQYYAQGYVQRLLSESGIPYTGIVHSGGTIADYIAQDYYRLAYIQATHCRDAIIQVGINDVRSGTSAATMEADYVKLANNLLGNGFIKAVYLMTMPPDATSTDGYATTTNQTANPYDSVRVAVNDWMRTSPSPFSGYFETADPVESSRDSGLWKVASGSCGTGGAITQQNVATCDGLHVSTYGVSNILNSLGNVSGILQ